jgi:hypothetical protein
MKMQKESREKATKVEQNKKTRENKPRTTKEIRDGQSLHYFIEVAASLSDGVLDVILGGAEGVSNKVLDQRISVPNC